MPDQSYEALVLERFAKLIKLKTISSKDGDFDKEPFDKFLPTLKELYPKVFEVAETTLINEYGILLRIKGKDSTLPPVVMMAHHDVVAADEEKWQHPPFEGEVHDGYIWGRGTIDTKGLILSFFEAMQYHTENGFVPQRDIYFASSNCEEVAGDTMVKIVEHLKEKGVKPWFVFDEGGAIMLELPMGVTKPYAMVAVSEKGWATVKLTATSKSLAHSAKSTGNKPAIEKLMTALNKLEKAPMKSVITPALEGMLSSLSNDIPAPLNIVLKNIKLLKAPIKKVLESTPDTAAMISSTITLVGIEAAPVNNLTPETAVATLKLRIAPHDTVESVLEHIKTVVGADIEMETERISPPAPISDHNTKSFAYISDTIKKVFPNVGVAPFILNAGTDSRHFAPICKEVYRFGAFSINNELFNSVHNENERIPVDVVMKCIEFYKTFIENLN